MQDFPKLYRLRHIVCRHAALCLYFLIFLLFLQCSDFGERVDCWASFPDHQIPTTREWDSTIRYLSYLLHVGMIFLQTATDKSRIIVKTMYVGQFYHFGADWNKLLDGLSWNFKTFVAPRGWILGNLLNFFWLPRAPMKCLEHWHCEQVSILMLAFILQTTVPKYSLPERLAWL